jgi:hypothetical protein
VENHDRSMKAIRGLYAEAEAFLKAIGKAAVWPGEKGSHLFHEHMEAMVSSIAMPDLEVADALCAELLALDASEVLDVLRDAVNETVKRFIGGFRSAFEDLYQRSIIGKRIWTGTDAGKYDFYRLRRMESKTGETVSKCTEREEGGGTWSEYEVVTRTSHLKIADVTEHHEHHLYNAHRVPLPARQVPKPPFVMEFLTAVPKRVQPYIFIMEGDMAREEMEAWESPVGHRDVQEVTRKLVRSGSMYSPSVTLGEYSLVGWSGLDV